MYATVGENVCPAHSRTSQASLTHIRICVVRASKSAPPHLSAGVPEARLATTVGNRLGFCGNDNQGEDVQAPPNLDAKDVQAPQGPRLGGAEI